MEFVFRNKRGFLLKTLLGGTCSMEMVVGLLGKKLNPGSSSEWLQF